MNGCIYSTTINLTSGTGPTDVDVATGNAACGANNGSLSIGNVTGGTGPYSFSVDNGDYSNNRDYSSLAAGSHTVDVRDANGCVFSTTVTIGSGTGPTAINVSSTNENCGNSNGTITINSTIGGTAPYTYSVDGSPFSGNLTYTGLAAGTHAVQVMDANGCLYLVNVDITNSGGPSSVDITPTNADCGAANGAFTINGVNGGGAPYSYSFNGGAFTSEITYTDLSAGSYTLEIRDANNCVFSTAVNISNIDGPTDVELSANNAACGVDNGRINIGNVTGGTAPYEFSVDGGAYGGATTHSNLAAGIHTVDVRDANGCVFAKSITIGQGEGPTAMDINPTNASCGSDNGRINITGVTGGTGPYTYSVDNGPFSGNTNYTDLSSGTHVVEVMDANGCTFSELVTIGSGTGPTAVTIVTDPAACGSGNGGLVIGNVTGGTGPYTYSVDNGSYSGNVNYNNLTPGSHTVDIRDANGCIYSTTVVIGSNGGPTDVNIATDPAACGADNGTLSIGTVTGGDAPYTYSVDGGNYTGNRDYTNLSCRITYCSGKR